MTVLVGIVEVGLSSLVKSFKNLVMFLSIILRTVAMNVCKIT